MFTKREERRKSKILRMLTDEKRLPEASDRGSAEDPVATSVCNVVPVGLWTSHELQECYRYVNVPSSRSAVKRAGAGREIILCEVHTHEFYTGDHRVESSDVTRVILVSGKHYYALDNYRESIASKNVAIVRLESLCPFPTYELLQEIEKYKNAKRE